MPAAPIRQLLQVPTSQRQLVVVQPDEVLSAKKTASDSTTLETVLSAALSVGGYFRWGIWGAAAIVAKDAYLAWEHARDSGLNVMAISYSEASQLNFPPGHPCLGTLYALHPAKPSLYYTSAMFHRMAFEHKFSEAVDLLMSLGASSIEVNHVNGWSREFSASMSVPIPSVSGKASASEKASEASTLLFKAEFENDREPELPADMVWYAHEPTWNSVASGRMKYGMKEFSLTVAYQDDYGVNAGLQVKAAKAGLDLGGDFGVHKNTTWTISGKFSDRKTKPVS